MISLGLCSISLHAFLSCQMHLMASTPGWLLLSSWEAVLYKKPRILRQKQLQNIFPGCCSCFFYHIVKNDFTFSKKNVWPIEHL